MCDLPWSSIAQVVEAARSYMSLKMHLTIALYVRTMRWKSVFSMISQVCGHIKTALLPLLGCQLAQAEPEVASQIQQA